MILTTTAHVCRFGYTGGDEGKEGDAREGKGKADSSQTANK